MRILSEERNLSSKKTRVVFENGTALSLYASDLKQLKRISNRMYQDKGEPASDAGTGGDETEASPCDIPDDVFYAFIEKTILPRAKTRALHLISKMDRTERDVREKLKIGGYPADIIDKVMDFMKEYRYIDDLSFSKSFIRTYMERKSLTEIKRKLSEKGVMRQDIEEAVSEVYEGDEDSIIREYLRKRGYDRESADAKEKAKTVRFLIGKGFSYDSFSDLI